MTNQPHHETLDENLSRMLQDDARRPRLSQEAETKMLAALRAKQAELFPKPEIPMDHAVTPAGRNSLIVPVTVVAVLACLICLALFFAPEPAGGPGSKLPLLVESEPQAQVPVKQDVELDGVTRSLLDDGTIVIARRDSKYSVDEVRRITLECGELYLIVAKADEPFVVKTSNGEVTATGTRFFVSKGAEETTAAVAQGRVKMSGDKGQVELRAGEQGLLSASAPPTREPAPRLSHLVSWAKEALAQEDMLVGKAESENGLIAMDPWGQETRLTLRKYDVDVYIEDGIARTTIDQTFFNHYPWNTEGTFYFPLPPDASVSRLAMYVNGTLNEGGMVERGRGQEIYNDILYQRRDPALLEMMEGNVFKMRIFPLEGRQEKRIFLSYTQKLEELYSTLRYWFPMDHTNSVANQLSIRVRVKGGAEMFDPQSSTHKLSANSDDGDLVLEYRDENRKPDQDLLLHLVPKQAPEAVRIATCEKDGFQYVFGRFTPEIPGTVVAKPRQWIVLNDVSASRSKIDVQAQRYILKRLLEEADDEDSVFLIDLNTRAHLVSKRFCGVRSEDTKTLLDHRAKDQVGGTNVAAGIDAAAKIIQEQKASNPHILYLGDGVATDGATEVFSLVRALPRTATFVGIGVGKKVDSLFLQAAADSTGGLFATINPDEDIDWRVFDLVAALNTPRLTKAKVTLFDSQGKEMVGKSAIAYPSSRSLSAGETLTVVARCTNELPAKIAFAGQAGEKPHQFEVSLDDAQPRAEFIPRLWAKRHIDELLKSDMERKQEIIELSKQYYVVTPFTSLIVLEDEAMYEEYQVERGRKDHWALYPAPKEIPVVKEAVDSSRWSWWGGAPGEDDKVEAKAKPESVRDIVESIQFRIDAPFYYWQPQRYGQGRLSLYEVLDNEADPTRLLTYWYLMASGEEEIAERVRLGEQSPDNVGQPAAKPDPAKKPFRQPLYEFLPGSNVTGWDILPMSGPVPPLLQFSARGVVSDSERLPSLQGLAEMQLGVAFRDRRRSPLAMMGDIDGERMAWPIITEKNKQLAPAMMLSQQAIGLDGQTSLDGISPELLQSFQGEVERRWDRINRDIRQFNRSYGYGGAWDDWGGSSIDLTRSQSARWYGGMEGLLGGKKRNLSQLALLPLGNTIRESDRKSLLPMLGDWAGPGLVVASFGESLGTQPGMCSVLAADYLLPRRNALAEKLLTPESKQEFDAVTKALANIGPASSRLEDSGLFWSYQGWSYRPQPWTFQPPTVQVYQGYNWSFDVTRYAPALYSSSFDILNEVVDQYQVPAEGKVSHAAKKLIDAARAAIQPVRISYADDGPQVRAGSGDRFAITRRTDMYLEERMVCDGENVFHYYDELGLATRRPATALRLSSLRQFAPHLLDPADSLAARHDIDVSAEDQAGFELTLTPLVQAEDEKQRYHVTVSVGPDGRIHSKLLTVGGQNQLRLTFQYAGAKITAQWFDEDDKQLTEFSYTAEPLADEAGAFSADVSDFVVFDMPLRKPSYYEQRLPAVNEKDIDAKIKLHRHVALAQIQQLHWRRWGNSNEDARKALTEALVLMKNSGQQAKIGDLTLLGSTGLYNSAQEFKNYSAIDESQPLFRFYQMRHGNWQDAPKLVADSRVGLLGHLAAYQNCASDYKLTDKYDYFAATFPDSPLLLAATFYASNWGNQPEAWLKLYDHPSWRLVAMMMSASRLQTDEQRKQLESAFLKMNEEHAAAGYDLPITGEIAGQLRSLKSGAWKNLVQQRFDDATKSEGVAAILRFAEQAMSWGETDLADKALAVARQRLSQRDSLLGRFALAQVYWAGSRFPEALRLHDEILATLAAKEIAASPALLAAVARLAQQSGDHAHAIELEERALALEHPHLPELINLQAFRQRYNWLWQQYQAKLGEAANGKDENAVEDWLARAESAWQRWHEVDRQNPSTAQQMATLQMTAGRADDAWMYLSTVIDERPRDAQSYHSVGQWYQGRNELDEAQQWFARAYEWDTANPQWLLERAKVLDQMGNHDASRAVYRKIIDGDWAAGLQWYVDEAKKALD